MIDIATIILLIWLHFVADFIMQSDYVAKNKSKSNKVLLQHVMLYSIPFFLIGPVFALVNAALHFAVDYVTSRMTSYFWNKGKVHDFFVVIGLDQAIHLSTLILTYMWIVG